MPKPPQRIYRGEVRTAVPTTEHPDPAAAVAHDPAAFLKSWMKPGYPFPEGYNGPALTVGEHWTQSPEIIPERFVEPVLLKAQAGRTMGKREKTAVSHRLHSESGGEGVSWEDMPALRESQRKSHTAAERAEKQGVNTYSDLSGGDIEKYPPKAQPFKMAVVWEAHHPEHHEPGTNYEDELNVPQGAKLKVTGARLYIPKAGETLPRGQTHPSTFTHEERAAAEADTWERSSYSFIRPTTHVPWSRVQFREPIELPVGHKTWDLR